MGYDDIFLEVRAKVSTAAGDKVKLEDMGPQTRVFSELGMDSIDATELIMELERHFEITIGDNELFPGKLFKDREKECVVDGRVTEVGLRVVAQALPFADLTEFRQNPIYSKIKDIFTVGMIACFVCTKKGVAIPEMATV